MSTRSQPMRRSPPLRPAQDGPPIDAALIDWLDHNAGAKMIELPLHFAGDFDLDRATLRSGDLEIELLIDSTALSMTLRDHLASHAQSFPCTLWVRGTWGPLLPTPTMRPTVTVRCVVGPVEGTASRIRWVP